MDVLLDTIRAACAVDYPTNRFRIIVSDDAKSSELQKAVDVLHGEVPSIGLFYTARIKGKHHGYKAGNLNHGVRYTTILHGEPAEFIASLDADMIPEPHWLRALIPHLIRDPRIAMIAPPQVRSKTD